MGGHRKGSAKTRPADESRTYFLAGSIASRPTEAKRSWGRRLWPETVVQIVIVAMAALLLFWGLSEKYLWQDEAHTAVLAARMLRFGRPLAYDGLNLITPDNLEDIRSAGQITTSSKAAVDYYVGTHQLKQDTTWKWHPWGQFVVAALSLKLLGQTTLAARVPFALAGILTVLMLYRWVKLSFKSALMATLAAVLLVFNSYWILHGRQCRYYVLSSLLLVLTLLSYGRWQRRQRSGAAAFVIAAWCWFQIDYGTVWPVLAVLFTDAFIADWRNFWRPALVGVALTGLIAPFAYYYELWGRMGPQGDTLPLRFWVNLFNINEYIVPVAVVAGALSLIVWRWKVLPSLERRLVATACGIIFALSLWIPAIGPFPFLRYLIMAAPVGCLLSAWLLVRGCGERASRLAWLGALVLAFTPWLTMPLHAFVPPPFWYPGGAFLRPELSTLRTEVFGHPPDPNRLVIEWLKRNAAPTDEILVNYEDIPMMFYLPNPIRGGVAAFRAEDDSKTPPSFLIMRRSVQFVHWPIFEREAVRHQWTRVPLSAPDIIWGNNPDPSAQTADANAQPMIIARRVPNSR